MNAFHIVNAFHINFFFPCDEDQTQGLMHASKALYHFDELPAWALNLDLWELITYQNKSYHYVVHWLLVKVAVKLTRFKDPLLASVNWPHEE